MDSRPFYGQAVHIFLHKRSLSPNDYIDLTVPPNSWADDDRKKGIRNSLANMDSKWHCALEIASENGTVLRRNNNLLSENEILEFTHAHGPLWWVTRSTIVRLGHSKTWGFVQMASQAPYKFEVLPVGQRLPSDVVSTAFLLSDKWDDWFRFQTQFTLIIFDDEGTSHHIGEVKIGQFHMSEEQRAPELPPTFQALDKRFFSLGQDDSYYLNLNNLGPVVRDRVLGALRDVAIDLELFGEALEEEVTRDSLLRSVKTNTVRGQFHRMASGGARLSRYYFSYTIPTGVNEDRSVSLSFRVKPESNPPSNIHVLIGRNGVGKTRLLNDMTNALVKSPGSEQARGSFSSDQMVDVSGLFAGLVSVTFSAFDPFHPLPIGTNTSEGVEYAYIGLKRPKDSMSDAPKTPYMLAEEFAASLKECLRGVKGERWRRAVEILELDPLFDEANISALANGNFDDEAAAEAISLFEKLSSGHKIVLLTITRLVETVQERTLVLLDEPEAHLHPPLLSAFVRALSDLLTNRNGVAIMATHSPVVLQEVPKDCTWILRRVGHELVAERPELETFGENVGALTREVFGLEVTQSGFHRILREAVELENDFESVVARFDDQLGAEARAIIRALIATRDAGSEA